MRRASANQSPDSPVDVPSSTTRWALTASVRAHQPAVGRRDVGIALPLAGARGRPGSASRRRPWQRRLRGAGGLVAGAPPSRAATARARARPTSPIAARLRPSRVVRRVMTVSPCASGDVAWPSQCDASRGRADPIGIPPRRAGRRPAGGPTLSIMARPMDSPPARNYLLRFPSPAGPGREFGIHAEEEAERSRTGARGRDPGLPWARLWPRVPGGDDAWQRRIEYFY